MIFSKNELIELAIENNVLKFGEFKLKSGRISPYFFNAGLFYTARSLAKVGQFYAQAIMASDVQFEHLFGPAYKGLPLATATAIALHEQHKIHCTVTFNRKEAKDHGEGGILIGAPLLGKTIIIDDVITAGTAFREAESIITEQSATISAVAIFLNRQEIGLHGQSTLKEIENKGIQVISLLKFEDLLSYIEQNKDNNLLDRMLNYKKQYFVA